MPCRLFLLATALALAACSRDPDVAKIEYLKSGDAYAAQGKLNEAVVQYRNAIQQDPRFGEARFKLAEILVKTGDRPGAYLQSVRAADLLPRDARAQIKAGEMLLLTSQFEDARSRADKALQIDPKSVDAYVLRGNALAGLKQIDLAVQEMEKAIRLDQTNVVPLTALGSLQLLKGARADAEASYKRALQADPDATLPRIALANYYWSAGQPLAAAEVLQEAVDKNPKDLVSHRSLGYIYVMLGRTAEAEPHLKIVLETKEVTAALVLADIYHSTKRTPEALRLLDQLAEDPQMASLGKTKKALLLYQDGHQAEAHAVLDELIKAGSKDATLLMTKVQFLVTEKKLNEGLKLAQTAVASDPQSLVAHLGLARLEAVLGNRSAAITSYLEALRIRPRFPPASIELATQYIDDGRPDEALGAAREALAVDPSNAAAVLVETRALLIKGSTKEAAGPLKALATKYPQSAVVHAQLGILYTLDGNDSAARTAFEQALRLDPVNVDALTGLLRFDLAAKNTRGARARVETAVERSPNDAPLLVLAARAYSAVGDSAAAERSLKRAIEVNPTYFDSYNLLGTLYTSQGRLPEAVAEYNSILRVQPKSVAARTMMGILLYAQDKPDEARREYETALGIDPRAPIAANNLAWIYAETGGNLDLALKLAQTAREQLPDTPEISDTLGWVYYKKGVPELAAREFLASSKKAPNNPTYMTHLGLAYAKTGDLTRAKDLLERAAKSAPDGHASAEARVVLEQAQRSGL